MKNQTFRLNDEQLRRLEDAMAYTGHSKQKALLLGLEAYLKQVERLKKRGKDLWLTD